MRFFRKGSAGAAVADSEASDDPDSDGSPVDDVDRTFLKCTTSDREICHLKFCCAPWICCLTCCGITCLLLAIAIGGLAYAGWSLVSLEKNRMNCHDPNMTPLEFPRNNGCLCRTGYKTDAELKKCLSPCTSLDFVLGWEKQAKALGYKLVFFPSRTGPKGEKPVNISAWWLPPAPRLGVAPKDQPRIVALHGLASNNNHCGVQATCFLLRSMGYGCLTPSVRDFGLSGKSDHPSILTWAYDYHMDLLGAWDYAVKDPDGIMGGASTPAKVGIAGFSKGALGAALAFGMDRQVPGAWLDSAPFSGLDFMIHSVIQQYAGFLTPPIAGTVNFWAKTLGGGLVDYYDAWKVLENCSGPARHVAVSQGWFDDNVPVYEGDKAMELFNGLPHCYKAIEYTPPEYCNGQKHHQEMWEFPDDTREVMCNFWTETFGQTTDYCALASLPKYQLWDPPKSLPPGTPPLKVNV
mmetsp:Transcript_47525/g.133777  ORF Transcript_47525/g.133777 Transcript_47525/m.133777 type:complete len:464 (+) Transcript_47525:96-1487(+)